MATTSEYLTQLQTDKQNLVDNLVTKGVNATNDETFTSLVPKVLDIQSGSGEELEINDARYLFYQGARLNSLDSLLNACKNVTSCYNMFYNCQNLTELDLSSFNTSSVTIMAQMFNNCSSLTSLDVSNFDTSNVTNMAQMFNNCSSLTSLDVSNFDTSSVTRMDNMFSACLKLIEIDLSNFDTSNVTNMANMFNRASALTKANISGFTSTRLTTNTYMFYNTNLITLIIDNQNLFKMTATSMLQNTPIANGTGYIYVPDNMVETYKSATNWSTYADQIKPISELSEET